MIDEDYFTQKYSISHTDKHSNAENKIEEDTQKNSEKLTEIPTKTNTQTDLNSHAEAHLKTHPQTHKPPTFQYFAIDGCIILALLEPPGECYSPFLLFFKFFLHCFYFLLISFESLNLGRIFH